MQKATYFISDIHLGVKGKYPSEERERRVSEWLLALPDIERLYLVGDIFDYWFEYKTVIPKGHLRWLSALLILRDRGVEIIALTGNHDLWLGTYLTEALDIPVVKGKAEVNHYGYDLLIAHGDGLGPGDYGYKWLKKALSNSFLQWLFARLHPNLGLWLMRTASASSRYYSEEEGQFLGADKEWLIQYSLRKSKESKKTYYIFGHRHLPIDYRLPDGSRSICLGDWLYYETYGRLDNRGFELCYANSLNGKVYG